MYQWDDILIVGDSYACSRHTPDHWPAALAIKLTGREYDKKKPRGEGFPGGAWWSTRKNLLKELDVRVPKILIICHTNEDRLPSDHDYGLTSGCVHHEHLVWKPAGDTNYTSDIWKATCSYFKYLYSPSYHLWAMERWFIELDSILDEHEIPVVIHLHCFPKKTPGLPGPSNSTPWIFRNGVTSVGTLRDLSDRYGNNAVETPGQFANHFKIPENLKIADALYDAIVNFKPEQNGTVQNLNLLRDPL